MKYIYGSVVVLKYALQTQNFILQSLIQPLQKPKSEGSARVSRDCNMADKPPRLCQVLEVDRDRY